ncbi:MAG TPA: sarcosine oxidase subunit gamma family protein, partial [Actinomycetes bacterium]|nr:sarcosine oxidase subunit gamma family protein [Actinomycetes bacterium]
IARSPIAPAPPVAVAYGWQVSARRSRAELRIRDCTPLAKVLVRGPPAGGTAVALGVGFGRAARDRHGTLVVGSGPGEWLLLAPPGTAATVAGRVRALPDDGLASVLDATHDQALVRISGAAAAAPLAKVCAIDLVDEVTPDGAAFRGSVAEVAAAVVRNDLGGERSYLLACERSFGQYLFDALLDAGGEFGIDVDGFVAPGA